jgi:hypothetical protein
MDFVSLGETKLSDQKWQDIPKTHRSYALLDISRRLDEMIQRYSPFYSLCTQNQTEWERWIIHMYQQFFRAKYILDVLTDKTMRSDLYEKIKALIEYVSRLEFLDYFHELHIAMKRNLKSKIQHQKTQTSLLPDSSDSLLVGIKTLMMS